MLCTTCRHCGLCAGDGTIRASAPLCITDDGQLPANAAGDAAAAPGDVGIAVDIGTTTIAAVAYALRTAQKLATHGEENQQRSFGSDVISRVAYAQLDGGYERLRTVMERQLGRLVLRLLGEAQLQFQSARRGRAVLRRIVLTGNTTMQSFAAGVPVAPLAAYPFVPADTFGRSMASPAVFPHIPLPECEVFIPPALSAFVGGDAVSAMVACGFCRPQPHGVQYTFLADAGTNCEMAVYDAASGQVVCTSSAAGPAFEGQGIECGMAAAPGAIAFVSPPLACRVIGGGTATGICGTGLISAAATLYRTGRINANGTLSAGTDAVFLQDGVYISQKDIRSFQLAKAAVRSGLEALEARAAPAGQARLYLAGGYGSALRESDAIITGMIPPRFAGRTIPAGNAALTGATLLLLSPERREQALHIAAASRSINLAEEPDFQERYIQALNFPVDVPPDTIYTGGVIRGGRP